MKFVNPFFIIFLVNFFIIFFPFTQNCLKIYQQNTVNKIKKYYKKKLAKDIKISLKKKKNNNVVANITKISYKMKNKGLLSIEKTL